MKNLILFISIQVFIYILSALLPVHLSAQDGPDSLFLQLTDKEVRLMAFESDSKVDSLSASSILTSFPLGNSLENNSQELTFESDTREAELNPEVFNDSPQQTATIFESDAQTEVPYLSSGEVEQPQDVSYESDTRTEVGLIQVNSQQTPPEIRLYPNPTTHFVQIDSETPVEEVSVFDLLGNQMISIPSPEQQMTLDVSDLRQGVYFVMLEFGEGKNYSKRLMVE